MKPPKIKEWRNSNLSLPLLQPEFFGYVSSSGLWIRVGKLTPLTWGLKNGQRMASAVLSVLTLYIKKDSQFWV